MFSANWEEEILSDSCPGFQLMIIELAPKGTIKQLKCRSIVDAVAMSVMHQKGMFGPEIAEQSTWRLSSGGSAKPW